MRRARRRGFSLLEVLLATGILIGSSIVLMELASIGMRHAANARDESRLQRVCQTKLNEIVVGVSPAETVRPTPCDDDPGLTYWVNVHPTDRLGLVKLEVVVTKNPNSRRPHDQFKLVRWVRDPKSEEATPSPAPIAPLPPGIALGGSTP